MPHLHRLTTRKGVTQGNKTMFARDLRNLISPDPLLREKPNGRRVIRKRHWALAAVIAAAGGWIASATTASIPPREIQTATPLAEVAVGAERVPVVKAVPAKPGLEWVTVKIRRGDTLGTIFKRQGYDTALPLVITGAEPGALLKKIRVGRELSFGLTPDGHLARVVYPLDALESVVVEIGTAAGNDTNTETITARIDERSYEVRQHATSGEITSSLYEAAAAAGVSVQVIMEMVEVFGWDIDFALDLRRGDRFTIVHEEYMQGDDKLSDGHIVAAEFVNRGETYRAIRFTDSDGESSYYTPDGKSMRGTFLRTPVQFSRISSRFTTGRFHPILKRWRAHKGVDYAAPSGTPIRATADGKVVHVGTNGGYGKAVVLQHAGRFSTLYGHLSGYKRGLRTGGTVRQGDTIGYVGSTGLATGPHLHYEFRVDGVHRNPLTYKFPKQGPVPGQDMARYMALASDWSARLETGENLMLAQDEANPADASRSTDATRL